jgi:hypothetical protein
VIVLFVNPTFHSSLVTGEVMLDITGRTANALPDWLVNSQPVGLLVVLNFT